MARALTLRRPSRPRIDNKQAQHHQQAHSMSDKTILLVEDNPDDAELTLMALTRITGVDNIIVAHDSVEVLRYLTQPDTASGYPGLLPTVIFLDLKMPKVNGIEVLQRRRGAD